MTALNEMTDLPMGPMIGTGDRRDDAEVAVLSASISGVTGELSPHSGARVEVEILCGEGSPSFIWAFTLTSNGQQIPLVRAESPFDRPVGPSVGVTTCWADIEQLPLLGGSYLLRVLVFDPSDGRLLAQRGWTDTPTRFNVQDSESFSRTLFRIAGVMVLAEIDWNVAVPLDRASADGE